jgi:hypothetical protein
VPWYVLISGLSRAASRDVLLAVSGSGPQAAASEQMEMPGLTDLASALRWQAVVLDEDSRASEVVLTTGLRGPLGPWTPDNALAEGRGEGGT